MAKNSAAVDADNPPEGATASMSSDDRRIPGFHIYSYDVVENAANDFSEESKIGEGRFGPVYKVESQTGQNFAVKMLNVFGRRPNSEFQAMTDMLAPLRHPNLVNLIGCSTETADDIMDRPKQRLLVYEFMPLGSLDKHLHDLQPDWEPLDWPRRMRIALGIARGLSYLHNTTPPVLFGDLKTSKILLDDTYLPRLSGFGLAKLGDHQAQVSRDGAYCAPEYCASGRPTQATDAYSFGVILLELITGRRSADIILEQGGNIKLYDWFYPMYEERKRNKLDEVVDPVVRGKTGERESLFKAAAMAVLCLHREPLTRPIMSNVVAAMVYVLSHATAGGDQITIGQGSTAAVKPDETRVEHPQLEVEDAKDSRNFKRKRQGDSDDSC